MTGKIDLDGDRAIIEEGGELSIYALADVEEGADGSWAPVAGAEPSGTLNLGAADVRELSVSDVLDAPSYPTQADLPSNKPVGFIALIEDENRIYFEGV